MRPLDDSFGSRVLPGQWEWLRSTATRLWRMGIAREWFKTER